MELPSSESKATEKPSPSIFTGSGMLSENARWQTPEKRNASKRTLSASRWMASSS